MAHSILTHGDQPLNKALKVRIGARRAAAIVCASAIALICVYSAVTIHGIIAGNSPTVTFTLGTVYRDVIYSNSQTQDL